jgi:DNA-binding transcriptional regulator YiaG
MTPLEFKICRIKLNLTQEVLAKRLCVTEQTIRNWEKGRRRLPGWAQKMLRMQKANRVNYRWKEKILAELEAITQ